MPIPELKPQYPDYGNVLAKGAYIKGTEARNALMQQQIQDYPEERNYLRKQRGWAEEDRATSSEDRLRRMKREDIDKELKVLEIGSAGLAKVEDIVDYAPYREWMVSKIGVNPELLVDPSNFIRADGTPDEEAFDQWRNSKLMEAKDRIDENKAFTLSEKQARFDKSGKVIAKGAKWGKEDKFGGLTANQWILKLDRDRKFKNLSDKQKQATIEKGVALYNKTFEDKMVGGLLKDRPDEEKWLENYVSKVTGKEKPTEKQTKDIVTRNEKTGIVKVKRPNGAVEYYNQNKERVTKDGNPLAVGKIK